MTGLAQDPGDAGPEALRVFERFLAAFTAADPEGLLGNFWPDALVWGTTMAELATSPEAVRAYFEPIGRRPPGQRWASLVEGRALALSASAALLSATWRVEAAAGGAEADAVFRVSLAVAKREGRWRIAQFHNSPRPAAS